MITSRNHFSSQNIIIISNDKVVGSDLKQLRSREQIKAKKNAKQCKYIKDGTSQKSSHRPIENQCPSIST